MGTFQIGGLEVTAQAVIHPGQTVGYRVSDGASAMTYLPDHEPALGVNGNLRSAEWASGHDLAQSSDLLIHDAQYTAQEYEERVGWGHSQVADAVALAKLAGARRLVTFHHDPSHNDEELDEMLAEARRLAPAQLEVLPGQEGATYWI
jgi:phosphoribosyl 1,2-cyclic phosphodiesterase